MWLEDKRIKLKTSSEELLKATLSCSTRIQEIDPSEGYWVDHWHYNIDLLESYFSLFPEKKAELLLENKTFTFYNNPIRVRPRSEKHVLFNGKVRQFNAIFHDKEKRAGLVKTQNGKGAVYKTNLLAKLFVLLLNKMASLDPFGAGIEMEADRPNWYDALNGLPGLLGSSVSETFELKRLILFLKESLAEIDLPEKEALQIPAESYALFEAIEKALGEKELSYWEKTTSAKEAYREKIRRGIKGDEKTIDKKELLSFLDKTHSSPFSLILPVFS